MRRLWILLACLLGTSLAGCTQSSSQQHPAPTLDPTTGEVPLGPAWSFTDTDGIMRSRDAVLGAPSAIFFMATWCPKCQSTAPRLADLHDEFATRGLSLHTVTWDPQEDNADLEGWKSRYDQPWPHGRDVGSRIAQTFDITRQSSIVVLDGSGNLVQSWTYATPSAAALREAVEEAFARS